MGHVHPCSIAHCYINSRHTHRTPQDILALSDPDTFGPGPTHPQVSFQSGEPERSSMIHIHIHIYIYISIYPYIYISIYLYLVGGFKHEFYFSISDIGSSFPLTNSYFSRWLLHHQPDIHIYISIYISIYIPSGKRLQKKKRKIPIVHGWIRGCIYIYIYVTYIKCICQFSACAVRILVRPSVVWDFTLQMAEDLLEQGSVLLSVPGHQAPFRICALPCGVNKKE